MDGILLILVVAAVYFLPSIIAFKRGHRKAVPILLVNLFLGWSGLAWIIALIWSLANDTN